MFKSARLLQQLSRAVSASGATRVVSKHTLSTPSQFQRFAGTLRHSFATSTANSPSVRHSTLRTWRASRFRAARQVRHQSSNPTPPPVQDTVSQQSRSLSQRMKDMSRKYGWTVVGIYLGLSALDFPLCFFAVKLFGPERIGKLEHAIIDGFWGLVEKVVPALKDMRQKKEAEVILDENPADSAARESGTVVAYTEAVQHSNASTWTLLLLAYGVHKSLFFIRIPITLAITPRIVKMLRARGWKIGNTGS